LVIIQITGSRSWLNGFAGLVITWYTGAAREVDMNNVLQELRSASAHAWEHTNRGTRDSAAACLERLDHAIEAASALSPTAEVVDAVNFAEDQATLLREVVNNQSERGQ